MKEEFNLQLLLDAMKDAAVVYQGGNILCYNNRFEQYKGANEKELGKWIEENATAEICFKWIDLKNETIFIDAYKRNISKKSTLVTLQDVTHISLIRETNKTNARKFQILSNATMEGIVMLEGDQVVDANNRIVEILGTSGANELMQQGVSGFFKKRDWKRLVSRSAEVFEFEIENAKGIKVNIEAQLTVSDGATEKTSSLVVLDITQKKRIEHDLLQTKERFRLLVESSPVGLFLVVENKIKYINKSACDLLGVNDEEVVF